MKQVIKRTMMLALVLLSIGLISGTMRTNACDQVIITTKKCEMKEQKQPVEKKKANLFPDFILGHSLFQI